MKKYSEFLYEDVSTEIVDSNKKINDIDDVLNSIRVFYKELKSSIKDVDIIEQRDPNIIQADNKKAKSKKVVAPGTSTTTTTLVPGTSTTTTTLAPGTSTTTTTLATSK
jgi:hypothetical protein